MNPTAQSLLLSLAIGLAVLSPGPGSPSAQAQNAGIPLKDVWVTFQYLSGNGATLTAQALEKFDHAVRCKVGSQYEIIPADWLTPADRAKLGFREPTPAPAPTAATPPPAPRTDSKHYRGYTIEQVYAYGLKLGGDASYRLVRSVEMTPAERNLYGIAEPAEAERIEKEAAKTIYGDNMNIDLETFRRLLSAGSPAEAPPSTPTASDPAPAASTATGSTGATPPPDSQLRRLRAQAHWYHQRSSQLSPPAPPIEP